jgi:hypothetical protein
MNFASSIARSTVQNSAGLGRSESIVTNLRAFQGVARRWPFANTGMDEWVKGSVLHRILTFYSL